MNAKLPRVCAKCEQEIIFGMRITVVIRTEFAGPDGPEVSKKRSDYCGFLCAGRALNGVPAGPVPDTKAVAETAVNEILADAGQPFVYGVPTDRYSLETPPQAAARLAGPAPMPSACAIANLCKKDPACGSYTPICSKTWVGP